MQNTIWTYSVAKESMCHLMSEDEGQLIVRGSHFEHTSEDKNMSSLKNN